jgi:carbonic anhydrase
MISAGEALARLREGNARFVASIRDPAALLDAERRARLAAGQEPFAVVLGCSDSRVPAELVFDQGFGDLFVIRVAGNIVAPSQVGSVEFAVERFGSPLVVVLGHSQCGAIGATLEQIRQPSPAAGRNLRSIVNRIRPAIEPLVRHSTSGGDSAALYGEAVRANIRAAAEHLRTGSEILERVVAAERLRVVGAEYSLESGVVDFFDGVPD